SVCADAAPADAVPAVQLPAAGCWLAASYLAGPPPVDANGAGALAAPPVTFVAFGFPPPHACTRAPLSLPASATPRLLSLPVLPWPGGSDVASFPFTTLWPLILNATFATAGPEPAALVTFTAPTSASVAGVSVVLVRLVRLFTPSRAKLSVTSPLGRLVVTPYWALIRR